MSEPGKLQQAAATTNAEFDWSPSCPSPPGAVGASASRASRLAAAAVLARHCAELGLTPPLPRRAAAPCDPPPPQPPAPAGPDRRVEALCATLQSHSALVASSLQGQAAQLAAQQSLLQDVAQGVLFLAAKTTGSGATPAGRAGGAPAAAAPSPAHAASAAPTAARPPRSPSGPPPVAAASPESSPLVSRRAEVARALAARLRGDAAPLLLGSEPAGEEEEAEAEPRAPCSKPGSRAMHGGGGVLRVPISSRGADTVHPCSASPPPAARQSGGRSSGKPAWDDRTVALQSPRLRRISEGDPPPQPTRRLGLGPGGLGPHLLLQELQRLRGRHRRASGGAGSITGDSSRDSMERHGPSSPLRQANRPSTVPLLGGSSRAMQRAKHAAVTEKKKKPGCSAPAGLLDCKPVQQISSSTEEQAAAAGSPGQQPAGTMGGSKGQRQLEAAATVNAAPAAGRPDENNAAARAPAGGERACGTWDKQLVQRQARGLGIYGSVDAPALAAQLSEAAVEGLVEQLCRELLLRECAPCSSMA